MRLSPILACTLTACATEVPSPAVRDTIQLTGTITWEGHFERPHATRTIPVAVSLSVDGARARCELLETWVPERAAERTVFVRDDRGCRVLEPGSRRFVADRGEGQRLLELLSSAAHQEARTIAWQHPRLGDVEDVGAWQPTAAGSQLRLVWHRAHDQAVLVLQHPDATSPAPAAPTPPEDVVASAPPAPTAPGPARFARLAEGVYELVLPDADTRSLAVEFADHVVLCETSIDNAAGERLLRALDEHLPGKPVRHVLFGHYHPHYSGGLRPLLARGACVVAPPLGAAFAAEIAARPFRAPPDALATSGRTAAIETFEGRRVFRDATNELVAIDIGSASHHTDEYVVFYLPRQGLLFQGDLGWRPGTDGPSPSGSRARGLLDAIDRQELTVHTLVQGWPTHGRGTLPLADLRALLAR